MVDRIIKAVVIVLAIVAILLAVVIAFKDKNSGDNSSNNTPGVTGTPVPSNETPLETDEPTPVPTEKIETPLAGLTICIDPGHQSVQMKDKEDLAPWDTTQKTKCSSGTQGKFTNVPEYVVTLEISLKIKASLEAKGAKVVMTRETNDVSLSNIDRAKIGNDCNADVVLRIHCNGSDNANVNGIECWVPGNGDNSSSYKELAAYDNKLASELLDYLIVATGANRRNVNSSDNYTGLNWSTVPSIIIETGFMSNETEDKLLVTSEYQQKIADGITNWLINSTVLKRK